MGDASCPPPPVAGEAAKRRESFSTLLPIRILTHNVRFATDTPDESEKLWPDRFPYLSSHFKYHTRPHFAPQSTLVCMQEVLHQQLVDLHNRTFNTSTPSTTQGSGADDDNDWTYVGVGRNDGKTKGEYSPIFFRKSAWKCVHFETVWLNETGEVGKKGWDADSVRILTCAVLESVLVNNARDGRQPSTITTSSTASAAGGERQVMLAMNTHLDNEGKTSRRESAKLILRVASRLRSKYTPTFTFLTGDLNSHPDGDAYQILNARGSGFVDTRRLVGSSDNSNGKIYAYGNELTFTGFPSDPAAEGRERIDFVHLGIPPATADEEGPGEHDQVREMVQGYGVLPNRFDDKVWMSDHRGVVVDLLVRF
ncbi:uncharacterized protein Z519_00332 [Cladophialophora bantiana CBS 173.52]|uniref:Endonuclease/exonuclease/phosphatase domain-containing protein n=1 Tax=Cladophialophora bantiana (strain ATCC 10958 / CBS 173.52 / CDC B-1940 / NIH 8579) TaxID=1442370 RepID=A0A0D2F9A7_CLAB1|nr:uncharacterized protein Z519_00332 [Cladophialophora bantiana CBS 173.52]KIW98671.1 hypothetical protein Z519_00332 [Cladophialophora bantiana CBS 173.52]